MKNRKESGFTLVELAIVMVIIGLLIGGILKGQELIKNAAVSATAAQLKAFESAYVTFIDIYGAKPGDFSDAQGKIDGCSASNNCANGNGNGFIQWNNSFIWNAHAGVAAETYQAQKHLALADLIGGVDVRANGGSGAAGGAGLVSAEIGGFLYMGESYGGYTNAVTGNVGLPAGILVGATQNPGLWSGYGDVDTATVIERLDRKIDDGVATTGAFRQLGASVCFNGADYASNVERKDCSFAYKIN